MNIQVQQDFFRRALISAFVAAVFIVLYGAYGEQIADLGMSSLWFRLRNQLSEPVVPSEVLVVSLDGPSYESFQYPIADGWPRATHARFLERMASYGARKVVFDIIFHGRRASIDAGDSAFAEALKLLPVVIGSENAPVDHADSDLAKGFGPHALFVQSGASVGRVQVAQRQGLVQKYYSWTGSRAEVSKAPEFPSLAEAAVAPSPIKDGGPGLRDLINFYGPAGTIPTVSYYRVLDERDPHPPELFKDKIVFVGYGVVLKSTDLAKDAFVTPFGGKAIFGVEIHATQAANLLRGDWIRRADSVTERVWLSLLVLVGSMLLLALKPQRAALLYGGLLLSWLGLSYYSFLHLFFIPGLTAMLVLFLTLSGAWLYHYLVVNRVYQQTREAFGRHVSPRIVERIAQDPKAAGLGARDAEVALMFTDIAGFTPWVAKTERSELAGPINRYFSVVEKAVHASDGTLIRMQGDGVFVIWGAPLAVEEPRRRALNCGLEIAKESERLIRQGLMPALPTRIGIHFGPVVVGNFGSEKRFEYTPNGICVNVAARIEALNKVFGTKMLLSEAACQGLPAQPERMLMGRVRPAGAAEAFSVYAIFDVGPGAQSKARYQEALERFWAREFEQAEGQFSELGNMEPVLAKACATCADFARRYADTAPGADWQGEFGF